MSEKPCTRHFYYELLQDWRQRNGAFQEAQYKKAVILEKRHYALGVPATILPAIVGTTIFATLAKDLSLWARLSVAFLSIGAAVFAGLQTFLNYGKRAEHYRSVASQYGTIRREIELLEVDMPASPQEFAKRLRET
jgi:hypothetical protein